ncbi:MAG: hypothetical protein M0R47_08465 [Methylobacter sp.]|jgi:hypothetical protein|uniref:hypothetical protein n=1 Tax=Methylobacter sp. TaxID=2051955 RepID=UPI0025CC956D|nr:hypothetical protein [Methylobacter sp.]MCK9620552.1 hypothetical protein [Methylobacter sp.]
MIISNNEIEFEHLSSPSRSVVGEKTNIKAKTPSFVSSNAKGELRTVTDFSEIETLGQSSAESLKALFA